VGEQHKPLLKLIFWLTIFVGSRLWVLSHPPYQETFVGTEVTKSGYSDVKQDYERYANMWKYGLTPYFKQLYEYPPAAIPFTYLPLEIDLAGIGDYYLDYRVEIFMVEGLFFGLLLLTLGRLPINGISRNLALVFYIVAGAWAKDYWYEGLDLIFGLFMAATLAWRYLSGHATYWRRVVMWTLFWMSTAIKYMTIPLVLPLFLAGLPKWRRELGASIAGFLLVWLIPLAIFRTSLSVSLVYHLDRPLKYGALGTYIIEVINDYTGTEARSDTAPHFPMIGPISTQVESWTGKVFPLAIITYIFWVSYKVWQKASKKNAPVYDFQLLLRIVLGYYLVLFLTTKVFSSPFHIWYVPILALMPFTNLCLQVGYYLTGLWMLGLDTTQLLEAPEGIALAKTPWKRLRDGLRFVPMVAILLTLPKLPTVKQDRKRMSV
jgi:hypothetical protein